MERYFLELLACLRALSFGYQQMHWVAKGDFFYSDHLLLERLYSSASSELDKLAEKAMGITQNNESIDLKKCLEIVKIKLAKFPTDLKTHHEALKFLVELEKSFIAYCTKYEGDSKSTLGFRNLLGDLTDNAEGRVYLIQQVLSK